MGEETKPAAVADAGPLIHLAELDRLSLLAVFSLIHIADAVWAETVTTDRVSESLLRAAVATERHTVFSEQTTITRSTGGQQLHQGEAEALAICAALNVSLLLTDDLDARDAAQQAGLRPVGSLGIVVRAYRNGMISESEAADTLWLLQTRSSLFVTQAIIDLAIEGLRR